MTARPPTPGLEGDVLQARMARVDTTGFHHLLEGLPQQARDAWRMGSEWPLPDGFTRPSRVVFLGVGGSAIGADVVATVARVGSSVPVDVVRDYVVPPLDESALVFACSYSGNTEETIAAFESTLARPMMRIAITTGGGLAALAERSSTPVISYEWPGPPRTSLGYGVFVPLAILQRLGVLALTSADVDAALATLERSVERWSPQASGSDAKRIAVELGVETPMIVGAGFLEVAARRWAGELSENAKRIAIPLAIPEFDHNLLEGAAQRPSVDRPEQLILLDSRAVHPRNRARIRLTADALRAAGRRVQVVDAGGTTPLEAILASCALGSWVSYYAALLAEVDPLPISALDAFKQSMSEMD